MEQIETTDEKPKKPRLRYANALHPQMAAVVNGLYRFRTQEQAVARLERLKQAYTLASLQEDESPTAITLWVRDFEVSPEEEEKGYLGHYALVRCEQYADEDGYFTLHVTKIDRPLKNHPLRKRPVSRCPNWGHPILRGILKGKQYGTLDEANNELNALHLEYPETTIPGQNKLYLMIFSRRDNPKKPLERYVLTIKNLQGGGFIIESEKNTYTPKSGVKVPETEEGAEAPAPMGHFAAMVALKKKKKRPGT